MYIFVLEKKSSYSQTGREIGQELQLPEDKRAPRGGSIQQIATLVFKTFDLGQVNMHSILHLLKRKKKSLIRLLRNALSKKIYFSCFQYTKQKEEVLPRVQMSTKPTYIHR